jgi:GT2 family glycosyltransferase
MAMPHISVLIPTRDRCALLGDVLRGLAAAQAAAGVESEILVADNGSTDGTPALLDAWAAGAPGRTVLRVEQPGRSRALNRLLPLARAPLLVFTDDDVELVPNWLDAIEVFFAAHPEYDAAMGPVRVPPAVTDPQTLARIAAYPKTLPLFDAGDSVRDLDCLHGCNMIVRRHVFERVGPYDERLGVGASGLCEDTDLAQRIRRAGMRIGYVPGAVVYHTVDPARLTRAALREFHVRKGRSMSVMHPDWGARRIVFRLLVAVSAMALWSLLGQRTRRLKAWGHVVRHRELLRARRAGGGARARA